MNQSVFSTFNSVTVKKPESLSKRTSSKEKSRFIKRSPPAVKNFSGLEKRKREYKTKYSLDVKKTKNKSPDVVEYSDVKPRESSRKAPVDHLRLSRNHKKANSQMSLNT